MVTVFALGSKGFHTIKMLTARYGAGFLAKVIVATDKNVENDHSLEIRTHCKDHNIFVEDRLDNYQVETAFALVIGWRWLISCNSNTRLIIFHDIPLIIAIRSKEGSYTDSFFCIDQTIYQWRKAPISWK